MLSFSCDLKASSPRSEETLDPARFLNSAFCELYASRNKCRVLPSFPSYLVSAPDFIFQFPHSKFLLRSLLLQLGNEVHRFIVALFDPVPFVGETSNLSFPFLQLKFEALNEFQVPVILFRLHFTFLSAMFFLLSL